MTYQAAYNVYYGFQCFTGSAACLDPPQSGSYDIPGMIIGEWDSDIQFGTTLYQSVINGALNPGH